MKGKKVIFILAEINSSHTLKWVNSLSKYYNIYVFSYRNYNSDSGYLASNIKIYSLNVADDVRYFSDVKKAWMYPKALPKLKTMVKKLQPDIIHAHYISSYGLVGSFLNFHPYIVSVWGSDIFDFPNKSFMCRKLIQYVFKKADTILSTSNIMKLETQKYTNKGVIVTPFGVDCNKFKPMPELRTKDKIIIGTIKTLEPKYGIKYLIKAFKILVDKYPDLPLELHIVGGGSLKKQLQRLSKSLNIINKVKLLGNIPHDEVPKYFNTFSVSVSISESESFGVAVLEAEACGIPVIVSDIGGLPEVVENKKTGFIVPCRNPEETAKAIEKIVLNSELHNVLSTNAREFIIKNYSWDICLKKMMNIYKKIIKDNSDVDKTLDLKK